MRGGVPPGAPAVRAAAMDRLAFAERRPAWTDRADLAASTHGAAFVVTERRPSGQSCLIGHVPAGRLGGAADLHAPYHPRIDGGDVVHDERDRPAVLPHGFEFLRGAEVSDRRGSSSGSPGVHHVPLRHRHTSPANRKRPSATSMSGYPQGFGE